MSIELRCVHALNLGHASFALAVLEDAAFIFEDEGSAIQPIKEEVRCRIPRALEISGPILPPVCG